MKQSECGTVSAVYHMDEKIIAVCGATGSGKSTFVKLVTQSNDVVVGHGLASGKALPSMHNICRSDVNFTAQQLRIDVYLQRHKISLHTHSNFSDTTSH